MINNIKSQAIPPITYLLFFISLLLIFSYFGFSLEISIILILALIVFLTAFFQINFALVILIFSMLLSPELSLGEIRGRAVVMRLDDIFLGVVFFAWLAKMAINKELGLIKNTPLTLPIIVYILVSLVSTFFGITRGELRPKDSFFYLLKYIEYFLLFFMVANNIKSKKQIKFFIYLMFLVCLIVSLYAWIQHIQGIERPTAPFEGEIGEANTLAGYLLLIMGLIIGLIINSYGRRRVVLLGLLGVIFPVFLFTLSRSSWVAFIPMYLSFIVFSRRARLVLIYIFIISLIILPVFLPLSVKKRINETFIVREYSFGRRIVNFDESTVARIESWKVALEKWQKRPLLGYGVPAGVVIDNQYARVLRETGLIGFFVFVWLLVSIYRNAYSVYLLSKNDDFLSGLSLGFLCSFIGLLVHALGAETFIIIRIAEPFWFLNAILVNIPSLMDK